MGFSLSMSMARDFVIFNLKKINKTAFELFYAKMRVAFVDDLWDIELTYYGMLWYALCIVMQYLMPVWPDFLMFKSKTVKI